MAEEAKDPNAAKGETPITGEDAQSNASNTTELPDSTEAEATGSKQKTKKSETAKRPELANPNAGTAHTPTVAEDNAPSDTEAVASPLPSANKPDTQPTGPEGKQPKGSNASEGGGEAKPARAKKEKAPALEDKPFADFIRQDFLPSLQQKLGKQGMNNLDLAFEKQSLPIQGLQDSECWQVIGHWDGGKQFIIGFLKEDISGSKVFCCADRGSAPSLLESFMIDERKVNLDLLLLYTEQRLNAQKWLVRN
jgi:Protein of unknown function (DUF2996)